jgi:hypothetical protein
MYGKAVKLHLAGAAVVLTAGVVIASCAGAAAAGPLILLTNSWREVGNEAHIFDITDDRNGHAAERGTFTGTEEDGLADFDLEGDWNGGQVRMTVYRNPVVTWHATVRRDLPDTLVFVRTVPGGVDSLVLFRN